MSTAEIISLIASIAAMCSAFAAIISCFFYFRFGKPKIRFIIGSKPDDCCFVPFNKPDGTIENVGYIKMSIYNSSACGGTIGGIQIVYNKSLISVETVGSNFNPKWLHINLGYQDPNFFRFKVPLVVPAYSAIMGYFLIPKFPATGADEVTVDLQCKIIENKFKIKKIKKVTFIDATRKTNKSTYHYENEISYSLNPKLYGVYNCTEKEQFSIPINIDPKNYT